MQKSPESLCFIRTSDPDTTRILRGTVTHYLNGDQQGPQTLLLVSLILLTQPGRDARRVVFGVVAIRVFLPYVTLNMVLFLPDDAHAHPRLAIFPGPPTTPHTGQGVPRMERGRFPRYA